MKNRTAFMALISCLILFACSKQESPDREKSSSDSISKIEESLPTETKTSKSNTNKTSSSSVVAKKNIPVEEKESSSESNKDELIITSPLELRGKKPVEVNHRLVEIIQTDEEIIVPNLESQTTSRLNGKAVDTRLYGEFDIWSETIFRDLDYITKKNILHNHSQFPEAKTFNVTIYAIDGMQPILKKTYSLNDGVFNLDTEVLSHYPSYGKLRDLETSFPLEENASEATVVEEKADKYEAKTYKVGQNIPAGEYKVVATTSNSFYIEFSTEPSGKIESIITNDNVNGFTLVTVEEGNYFRFEDAYAIPLEKATPYKTNNKGYGNGIFRVGTDIPAGEYEIIKNKEEHNAYVAILSGTRGTIEEIIWNQNFDSNVIVSIDEGQYLEIRGGYIPFE